MTHDISNYSFGQSEKLFLDTNIWLYINAPKNPRNTRRVGVYSQAFKSILEAQCNIYIDILIISEFINTCARLEWNTMDNPPKTFKQFRKSKNFNPIAKNIASHIKHMLNCCSLMENDFAAPDINRLMDEYAKGDSDFNDQVIAEICRGNSFKLITDDGDFLGANIQIVTANRRLITTSS